MLDYASLQMIGVIDAIDKPVVILQPHFGDAGVVHQYSSSKSVIELHYAMQDGFDRHPMTEQRDIEMLVSARVWIVEHLLLQKLPSSNLDIILRLSVWEREAHSVSLHSLEVLGVEKLGAQHARAVSLRDLTQRFYTYLTCAADFWFRELEGFQRPAVGRTVDAIERHLFTKSLAEKFGLFLANVIERFVSRLTYRDIGFVGRCHPVSNQKQGQVEIVFHWAASIIVSTASSTIKVSVATLIVSVGIL